MNKYKIISYIPNEELIISFIPNEELGEEVRRGL